MKRLKICIGYDDHMSVYSLSKSELEEALNIDNVDDLNSFIVDNGERHLPIPDEADIFFDIADPDLKWFREELSSALIEYFG